MPPSGGSGQPEKILFAQIPSYKVDALEDMYDTLHGLAAAARSLPDTLSSAASPNPSTWQPFMKINELMPMIEAQWQILSILQDGRSYTKDELTDSEVAQLQVNLRYNRLAHPGPNPGLAPPDFNLDLDILALEAKIQGYESDNTPGKRPKDVLQRQLDYYRSLRTIRDEPDIAKARFLINEHNLKEMWRYHAAHSAAYKRLKAAYTALMAAMGNGNWAAAVTEFRGAAGNLAVTTDELLRKNRTVAAHGLL